MICAAFFLFWLLAMGLCLHRYYRDEFTMTVHRQVDGRSAYVRSRKPARAFTWTTESTTPSQS